MSFSPASQAWEESPFNMQICSYPRGSAHDSIITDYFIRLAEHGPEEKKHSTRKIPYIHPDQVWKSKDKLHLLPGFTKSIKWAHSKSKYRIGSSSYS